MKIFNFLLSFLLFVQATSFTYDKNLAKKNNKTFVWAFKGLALRQQPYISAQSIINIPYGQPVTLINNQEPSVTMSSKINGYLSSYKVEGKWVKVLYNGQEGYVFDGYLSNMQPLKPNIESYEDYLKRIYGVTLVKKIKGKNDLEKTTTYYKNGDSSVVTIYDGCFDTELYLKNITYREAVLFMAANNSDAGFPITDLKIVRSNNLIKISYYICS